MKLLKYVTFLEKQIEKVEQRIESLEYILETASDAEPLGNSDFIATENALMRLTEHHARLNVQHQENLKIAKETMPVLEQGEKE